MVAAGTATGFVRLRRDWRTGGRSAGGRHPWTRGFFGDPADVPDRCPSSSGPESANRRFARDHGVPPGARGDRRLAQRGRAPRARDRPPEGPEDAPGRAPAPTHHPPGCTTRPTEEAQLRPTGSTTDVRRDARFGRPGTAHTCVHRAANRGSLPNSEPIVASGAPSSLGREASRSCSGPPRHRGRPWRGRQPHGRHPHPGRNPTAPEWVRVGESACPP